jgi:hypothetical protein
MPGATFCFQYTLMALDQGVQRRRGRLPYRVVPIALQTLIQVGDKGSIALKDGG